MVAEQLSAKFGQGVVIDNRPGGGHSTALKSVAAAEPDGYALLLGGTGSLTINPALRGGYEAAPGNDLVPVALLATIPNVMAISSVVPAKTMAELIAYAKANPRKLSYGAGLATPPHLLCEYIRAKTGVDFIHIPYRGAVQAFPDLLSGRIQIIVEGPGVLLPHIQQGKVAPLVVTSATRLRELPDVPTLVEVGIDGYPPQTWMGIVAPPGTPTAIVRKLNVTINDVLNSTELKGSLARLGFTAQPVTTDNFASLIASDREKWVEVAKVANVKAE